MIKSPFPKKSQWVENVQAWGFDEDGNYICFSNEDEELILSNDPYFLDLLDEARKRLNQKEVKTSPTKEAEAIVKKKKLNNSWSFSIVNMLEGRAFYQPSKVEVQEDIHNSDHVRIVLRPGASNREIQEGVKSAKYKLNKIQEKRIRVMHSLQRDIDIFLFLRKTPYVSDAHRYIQEKYNQDMDYGAIEEAYRKIQKRMELPKEYRISISKRRASDK